MTPLAAILSALGVIVAALVAYGTASLTNKSSPYKDLAQRVMDLEKSDAEKSKTIRAQDRRLEAQDERMDDFSRDQDALVGALIEQEDYYQGGSVGVRPPFANRVLALMMKHRAARMVADRLAEQGSE